MLTFDEVIDSYYKLNNLSKDWLLYNYLPDNNYLNPSTGVRKLIIFIYTYYIKYNIYLNDYNIYNLLCSYCASKTKFLISR